MNTEQLSEAKLAQELAEKMKARDPIEVLREFDQVFALAFPSWKVHIHAVAPKQSV